MKQRSQKIVGSPVSSPIGSVVDSGETLFENKKIGVGTKVEENAELLEAKKARKAFQLEIEKTREEIRSLSSVRKAKRYIKENAEILKAGGENADIARQKIYSFFFQEPTNMRSVASISDYVPDGSPKELLEKRLEILKSIFTPVTEMICSGHIDEEMAASLVELSELPSIIPDHERRWLGFTTSNIIDLLKSGKISATLATEVFFEWISIGKDVLFNDDDLLYLIKIQASPKPGRTEDEERYLTPTSQTNNQLERRALSDFIEYYRKYLTEYILSGFKELKEIDLDLVSLLGRMAVNKGAFVKKEELYSIVHILNVVNNHIQSNIAAGATQELGISGSFHVPTPNPEVRAHTDLTAEYTAINVMNNKIQHHWQLRDYTAIRAYRRTLNGPDILSKKEKMRKKLFEEQCIDIDLFQDFLKLSADCGYVKEDLEFMDKMMERALYIAKSSRKFIVNNSYRFGLLIPEAPPHISDMALKSYKSRLYKKFQHLLQILREKK